MIVRKQENWHGLFIHRAYWFSQLRLCRIEGHKEEARKRQFLSLCGLILWKVEGRNPCMRFYLQKENVDGYLKELAKNIGDDWFLVYRQNLF